MTAQTKLQKLEKQQASIKDQIKKARQEEAKREATLYAKRCEIVGAAVLAELNDNHTLGSTLNPIIDTRTKSPKDRKTLGLSPAKKNETANAVNEEQKD